MREGDTLKRKFISSPVRKIGAGGKGQKMKLFKLEWLQNQNKEELYTLLDKIGRESLSKHDSNKTVEEHGIAEELDIEQQEDFNNCKDMTIYSSKTYRIYFATENTINYIIKKDLQKSLLETARSKDTLAAMQEAYKLALNSSNAKDVIVVVSEFLKVKVLMVENGETIDDNQSYVFCRYNGMKEDLPKLLKEQTENMTIDELIETEIDIYNTYADDEQKKLIHEMIRNFEE